MAPDTPNTIEEYDDEINTTAPQDKPATWKMPAPVFRKTSGRLPKDFEKRTNDVKITEAPEGFSSSDAEPKSPILKIVVVALAILAMIAFLLVFLTVVYFFFLRPSGVD